MLHFHAQVFIKAIKSKKKYLFRFTDVDVEVFLKFNKIRALTTDAHRIVKALRNSEFLKVSEDEKTICRITPIEEKEDADDCTIYVQRLPLDVDHEMITKLFSDYGPIAYISIPRFKANKKVKGFAFVEFKNVKDANKCLQDFRDKGFELPLHTAPNELWSISTYNDEKVAEKNMDFKTSHDDTTGSKSEKGRDRKKRKRSNKSDEAYESDEDQHDFGRKKSKNEESKKRKISAQGDLNDLDQNAPKKKKQDFDSDAESSKNCSKKCKAKSDIDDSAPPKKMKSNDSELVLEEKEVDKSSEQVLKSENETGNEGQEDKQCKKAKKNRKRKHHCTHETQDMASVAFQVMSKKDWKKLRNKYLNMQRQTMQQLKQYLSKNKFQRYTSERNRTENDKQETQSSERASKLEFTPGVIVKIDLKVPWEDKSSFKVINFQSLLRTLELS